VQLRPAALRARDGSHADLAALAGQLGGRVSVQRNAYLLRFPAGGHDVTVFRDGRVLVAGTRDVARARSLVARFLGG
jgi:hypothetical protein